MKTLKGWNNSGLNLDKFLSEPCRIDEDLYNYLAEIVPPQLCIYGVIQLGEAEFRKDGIYYYMTASLVNDKYFYLGILPEITL